MIKRLALIIVKALPKLPHQLKLARMKKTAEKFVTQSLMAALMVTTVFTFLIFVTFNAFKVSQIWTFLTFPILLILTSFFFLNMPVVYINRRRKEISRNVLFAGQYLLVKIQSGEPLFSSLIGVSRSYGAAGEVFNEIVQDIHFGARMEDAIDKTLKTTPSDNLKKILWEISNSIKTGADMTKTLAAILDIINEEYFIEIEKYGRKINSITLFYMVLAIILPSLGMTMITIIASFIGVEIPMTILYFVIFLIGFMQFMFIAIYRSIRPAILV